MISISSIEMKEIKDKLKAIDLINKVLDEIRHRKFGLQKKITRVDFMREEYDLVRKTFPRADLSCVKIWEYDKHSETIYCDSDDDLNRAFTNIEYDD